MTGGIKRVVLMSNNPDAVGGITTFVNTLANGFDKEGYEVELVTVEHMHKDSDYILDSRYKHHNGINRSMPAPIKFSRVRDYLKPNIYKNRYTYSRYKKEACKRLAGVFNTWGRDTVVIITQVYVAEHLLRGGVNLGSNNGPYVVGMYHGSFDEALRTKTIERLKKCFSNVDKFLCLTRYDADRFRDIGFTNIGFIHNPVSLSQANKTKKDKLVVSLGRYHPEKSLDYLIRAWSEIEAKVEGWKLELYGGGSEEGNLRKLINNLKLEDSVKLMGKTDDVVSLLSRASINALSSQHEGLPLVIVESARFAVPTVSFDCAPGISELIDNGRTGIITPKNNIQALAAAIYDLIRDEKKRNKMGRAAQQDSANYETTKIVRQWERVFVELEV